MQDKTAILIFGNTAAREAAVKDFTLGGGKHRNQQIADRLIRKTLTTAHQTGLPVLTCMGDQQRGSSFGERLANAIEEVYAQGYEQVITIGTDSPELSASHLTQTQNLLKQHPAVYGPATDGGVYLIGLRADTYERERFLQLAWQGERLQTSIAHAHQQAVVWLGEACDIDSAEDLTAYLESHTGNWVTQILQLLSSSLAHLTYFLCSAFSADFLLSHQLRGPPAVPSAV